MVHSTDPPWPDVAKHWMFPVGDSKSSHTAVTWQELASRFGVAAGGVLTAFPVPVWGWVTVTVAVVVSVVVVVVELPELEQPTVAAATSPAAATTQS